MATQQQRLLKELKDMVTKNLKEIRELPPEKRTGPEMMTIQRRWEEMEKYVNDTKAWTAISVVEEQPEDEDDEE